MQVYWLTVEWREEYRPSPLNLGVGITAISEVDARNLFDTAFGSECSIVTIQPVNDVGTLEQNHVRPNMENILKRGIWFPLGFEDIDPIPRLN
jgi:hypothetical protein